MMDFDLRGVSVMIGIPVNRDFAPDVVGSLMDTTAMLVSRGISMICKMEADCSIITFARSLVAQEFLRSNKTHVAWIDSDIVWKPEDFLRVLALATRMDAVGAAYSSKEEDPIITVAKLETNMALKKNEFGCIEVAGLGFGFVVIQRHVMEAMAKKAEVVTMDDGASLPMTFRLGVVKRGAALRPQGEDMAFFSDMRELGYKVYLDPTIDLGHVGRKVYRVSDLDGRLACQKS